MALFIDVFKDRLQRKASLHVKHAQEEPLLWNMGADGTPMRLAKTISTALVPAIPDVPAPPKVKARREGISAVELLSLRGYLKSVSPGGAPTVSFVPAEYRPLKAGKAAGFQYAACKQLGPLATQIHPDAPNISCYCLDRGVFTSTGSMLLQRHKQWHARQSIAADISGDPAVRARAMTRSLLDWPTAIACAAHDAHNGSKWSVQELLPDLKEGLSDLFIVIESLRNSFDHLQDALWPWLKRTVDFVDKSHESDEEVRQLWTTLGVGEKWLPKFVLFKPWFSNGKLEVSQACQGMDNAIAEIRSLAVYIFRWRKASSSRWCTMSPSCRNLVASECFGLSALVKYVRSSASSNEYYLHGFARWGPELRFFTLVCALSGEVADVFLRDIMADDRILRKVDELEERMRVEVKRLDEMPTALWEKFASTLPPPSEDSVFTCLRTFVVTSGLIAQAFIKRKVLLMARAPPFDLTQGDIEQNVDKLFHQPTPPTEEISRSIWLLLRAGTLTTLFPLLIQRWDSL